MELDLDQEYFVLPFASFPWELTGAVRWVEDFKMSSPAVIKRSKFSGIIECAECVVCMVIVKQNDYVKVTKCWLDLVQFLKKMTAEILWKKFTNKKSFKKWFLKIVKDFLVIYFNVNYKGAKVKGSYMWCLRRLVNYPHYFDLVKQTGDPMKYVMKKLNGYWDCSIKALEKPICLDEGLRTIIHDTEEILPIEIQTTRKDVKLQVQYQVICDVEPKQKNAEDEK
jgi:hypothetical protein